jgi:hypothetical protein
VLGLIFFRDKNVDATLLPVFSLAVIVTQFKPNDELITSFLVLQDKEVFVTIRLDRAVVIVI